MRPLCVLSFAFLACLGLAGRASTGGGSSPNAPIRSAINKSLPLLQSLGPPFVEHAACSSCHHNSLPAMTVALARSKGFKIDEDLRRRNAAATLQAWSRYGESIIEGTGRPNMALTASYTLVGLAADAQPPDPTTTAMVRFLAASQNSDGSWHSRANRPPMEYSDVTATALCMRALQLYSPKGWAEQTARQVARARAWLAALQPESTEESAFQLLGLRWADADEARIGEALKKLAARQRSDGGWAQLPTLESDAYGTGQALVALNQGGGVSPANPVYRRGVEFLIKTQHPDGSWFVQTRSFPIQAYFESGFPFGKSQFISAAATSWATMALTLAIG